MGSFFEFVAKNLGIGIATDRYKNLYVRGKTGCLLEDRFRPRLLTYLTRLLIPLTTSTDVFFPAPCSSDHVHRRIFSGSLFCQPCPPTYFFQLGAYPTVLRTYLNLFRAYPTTPRTYPNQLGAYLTTSIDVSKPARSLSDHVHRRI